MKKIPVAESLKSVGKEIELAGWIDKVRAHKEIVFLDLRDRTGLVQVVGTGKEYKDLNTGDVVLIKGVVKKRPEKLVNSKLETGTVEIEAKSVTLLNKTKPLPLPTDTKGYEIDEEVRLKYRYLDLRRPRLYKNLALRSRFIDLIRQYLFGQEFLEIETPILSETTPEGARDFVVPSRLQPGNFYALPQSPQQYKQMLMISGIEKYFQIARCFRDEDPRADRAYGEFTQLDLEMSFVTRENVMELTESMIISVYEKLNIPIQKKPFPIITYQEAIKKYGADKFDLRNDEEKKKNIQAFAWVVDFPFFEKTEEGGWTFTHNPFSAPKPEFMEDLLAKKNIPNILTTQYDLVCNGYEVGGGSIRNHRSENLKAVFEIMGLSNDEIDAKFSHMIEALSYGAPPHGGIAPGLDRLLTCITGEPSLREVIAFPMTSGGRTSVMKAPSSIPEKKLEELGIKTEISHNTNEKTATVYDRIVNLIEKNKISHKIFSHKPARTSKEASCERKTPIEEGAKALIMIADNKPVMFVLPAHLKADTKIIKKSVKIKNLRMATPEEVKKVTGVEIGAVPPFGSLFNIETFVDDKMENDGKISFSAGRHDRSIEIKSRDFIFLSVPKIIAFSK